MSLDTFFSIAGGAVLGMVVVTTAAWVSQWLESQFGGAAVVTTGVPASSLDKGLIVGVVSLMVWCCTLRFGHDAGRVVAASGFISVLIVLACVDRATGLLPDVLTIPLLWAGLLINTNDLFAPLIFSVWGAAAGYLVPWLFSQSYFVLRGRDGLGQGDVKLLAALGAWLGIERLLPILFVATALGLFAFLRRIIFLRGSWHAEAPFGPFLAAAAIALLLLPEWVTRPLFLVLGRP